MPATVTITRPSLTDNDTLQAAGFNALAVSSASVPDAGAGAEGVIRLAGDFAGTASSPALAVSGVTAGAYGASGANVPNLTVDAKGRLTAAANRVLTPADIGAAAASHTHTLGDVSGVTPAAIGAAAASHSHTLSDVSGVTPAAIGAAATSHGHSAGDISGLGGMATNTLSVVSASASNVNQTGSAGTALVFNAGGSPWVSLGVGKWLVIGTVCLRNGAGSGETEMRVEFSDNAGDNTFGAGASLNANTADRMPVTVVGTITVTAERGVFFKATPISGSGVVNFGSAGATNFAGAITALRLEA